MDYSSLLNDKQLKAISTKSQYARIIAGAGSGKTRVLTYRISYLLEKEGVDPKNILAIAFTNKVAAEMKNRISKMLPELSRYLSISTFHSFGAKFLRHEIHHINFPSNFIIFDDQDSDQLIKSLCKARGYSKKDDIVSQATYFIYYNKCHGISPEDVKTGNKHDNLLKSIYQEYEDSKDKMVALDFDDLLLKPILILKKFPEVREKWTKIIKHILVDEFQDTNNVQFELLKLLSSPKTSVYVVGDPDQTIYTWRGANQNIILDFDKYYPSAETIILDRNYRSTKTILNAANSLISHNKNRVPKNLYTENINGENITLFSATNKDNEATFVINSIKRLIDKNPEISLRKIAILYRSSYLSLPLEKVLVKNRIAYKIFGGLRFYQRKEIKDVLAYLHLMTNPNDDVSFERIVNVPRRKIGDATFDILKKEAKDNSTSIYNYLLNFDPNNSMLSYSSQNALQNLISEIESAKVELQKGEKEFPLVIVEFLTRIGYFSYLEMSETNPDERTNNVKQLINDMSDYLKKDPTSGFDAWLENCALASAQDEMTNDSDYVSLMTIHTAKGLEFDYVFIIGMSQSVFPNQRSLEESELGIEEERRLAYVAFTRAKQKLFLTAHTGYNFFENNNFEESCFIKEANLKMPNTNIFGTNNYYSNKNNDSGYQPHNEFIPPFEKPNDEVKTNNITDWHVGDIAFHENFGKGVVTKVESPLIIVINYDSCGKKRMVANHYKLSRLDVNLKDMA